MGINKPFKGSHGRVKVSLHQQERELLARLLDDVSGLLENDVAQAPTTGVGDSDWAVLEAALSAPAPQDPAVARLLPDGSRDDPELAASYRRLTEMGLRERKRAGLGVAAAALRRKEPVVLDKTEAAALLKGLTDVRLVVAERLGLHTDEDAEMLHVALRYAADAQAAREAGIAGAHGPQAQTDDTDPQRADEQRADEQRADDQWVGAAAIYDALTWWQEALIGALR